MEPGMALPMELDGIIQKYESEMALPMESEMAGT